MRALIADDEPLARQVLREELSFMPGIDLVGEAQDGTEALALIQQLRPDIAFLDLQMPGLTGFEIIRRLDANNLPAIVMVTAYDKFAIQAFEAGAMDYLLKPVSADRLAMAVDRASRLRGKPRLPPRKIVGRIGEEFFLLSPEEVLACQAEGDIVWIVTAKRKFQATMTLKALQERLEGLNFQRVHRSALVNVAHVRKMAALSSQRWLLTLHNNLEFVVSKRQASAVRAILSD